MSDALAGRRLFLTGAARGIGLACVERFINEGAQVGCFDRDADALEPISRTLRREPGRSVPW